MGLQVDVCGQVASYWQGGCMYSHLERRSMECSWAYCVGQGHVVRHSSPHHHCTSPFTMGDRGYRQAIAWIHLGWRRWQEEVAWTMVCLPKELGGLGIVDLRRLVMAFRAWWVWHDRLQVGQWEQLSMVCWPLLMRLWRSLLVIVGLCSSR